MTATGPAPWRRVIRLKEELRSGEFTLAEVAADLHEITLGQRQLIGSRLKTEPDG